MANNYQNFGYTEMYEWAEVPLNQYGLFVQFDVEEHDKILPYHPQRNTKGFKNDIIGVSTISSATISDDPEEWHLAYLIDNVGKIKQTRERLAVGVKQYDQQKEMSFIKTMPWEHYINIYSPDYDSERRYIKRSYRNEWVKVNLIGKTIVCDDGTCTPGEYCEPYVGNDKTKWGHAVPSESGYYVLGRFSDNTIIILFK